MYKSPFQNTHLATGLSHAIEFHHLGAKIPSLVVERLTREISITSSHTKSILLANLDNPNIMIGQVAFDLWKAGDLSLISLAVSIASNTEQSETKFDRPSLKLAC